MSRSSGCRCVWFQFFARAPEGSWQAVDTAITAEAMPWDLGQRVALTAGGAPGASARFGSFELGPLQPEASSAR